MLASEKSCRQEIPNKQTDYRRLCCSRVDILPVVRVRVRCARTVAPHLALIWFPPAQESWMNGETNETAA